MRARAKSGEGLRWLNQALDAPLPTDGCLAWPFGQSNRYPVTFIDGKVTYVHHVVLERTTGPRPAGMEAAHSCGRGRDDGCIDPRHLRWATPKENQADQVTHGKSTRGERQPNSKLTEADVRQIRRGFAEGRGTCEIAREFGVGASTICHIRKGRSWGWLV